MKTRVLATSWHALKAALTLAAVFSSKQRDDFSPEAA